MTPYPEVYLKVLLNAKQAVQRGDRQAARAWAEKAIAIVPDAEEPWLILAAFANPHASIKFLERALQINPESQRARKGMHWAVARLRREQLQNPKMEDTAQSILDRTASTQSIASKQVRSSVTRAGSRAVGTNPPAAKSLGRYRWSFLVLLLIAVGVTAGWAFWPGNASPVLAFLRAPHAPLTIPGVLADVLNPTDTLTPTPTFTPSPTVTPTPTASLTPTSTATATPTDTPIPTDTPTPTSTDTPWPTDTPEPAVSSNSGDGSKWIDVDLSNQMLYAYEGDSLVASFLVSTGVPQFPTVTGQYYTYVKYRYTLMEGDGYYLPDVPYTMYFYKGYGLHGTYWHNNFGHPMSHGCVNMYTPDAEWLYYWAPLGTLVNIHY